jgi:hypothetical protein
MDPDDKHKIQREVLFDPKVISKCKYDTNSEEKGNLKWYPVHLKTVHGESKYGRDTRRYVYFKYERDRTGSAAHMKHAMERYVLHKKKGYKQYRREDDDDIDLNELYKSDPFAATIDGHEVCCDHEDHWVYQNNEYYLCHKLLYAMLEKANELAKRGGTEFKIAPIDKCSSNLHYKKRRRIDYHREDRRSAIVAHM